MHEHSWRPESTQRDSLLNPQHDVIAGAALIVSKIMVQAEFINLASFQQGNGFIWPKHSHPARWGCSFVV